MIPPKASEMDVWLAGCCTGMRALATACNHDRATDRELMADGLTLLHMNALRWLRKYNDRVALDVPELPELERRMGAARTLRAKHEALRALLAARDKVVARKAHHDAVEAQAVMPLQLGLHPTGIGGEE